MFVLKKKHGNLIKSAIILHTGIDDHIKRRLILDLNNLGSMIGDKSPRMNCFYIRILNYLGPELSAVLYDHQFLYAG